MANNLHKFTVAEATSKMAQRAIVRVTPTISTTAYADGDVLFLTTEIPNAVLFPGGCSLLRGITIVDKDSNSINMDLVFMAVKKNLIGAVDGVQTIENVTFINKNGTLSGYSQYIYPINLATRNEVIYPSLDPSIFEVKFPNTDIRGSVTTY